MVALTDDALVERLYRLANGSRWRVPVDRFGEALEASAARAFSVHHNADAHDLERYFRSLHLEDLALACACAAGDDDAWEHFVREYRPHLYRAADAIDSTGGARDLADSLYADLFGLRENTGDRKSLFRYFHGRSSLITWLRAVLAQRHVDRLRVTRRSESFPDDDSVAAISAPVASVDLDRDRHLALIRTALDRAVAAQPANDRLRLACYYGQQLTLAQTGRLIGEHEATVSRALSRSRAAIRACVETELRHHGLGDGEIAQCFETIAVDAGDLDLGVLLAPCGIGPAPPARKKPASNRSQ
jgi:RNA polymerase sigma-70 factor (ECF subfamily)